MARFRRWGLVLVVCLSAAGFAAAQETTPAADHANTDQKTVTAGDVTASGPQAAAAAGEPSVMKDSSQAKDGADKDLDKKSKKKKKKKEKPPKLVPVSIVNGTLTMDGATGKALLNYDIPDLHYLYIWAPGIGTVVISNKPFAGAVEQKKGFTQNAVDVTVDGHKLEIYSDKALFDKRKDKDEVRLLDQQLMSVWVRVDTVFRLPTAYPAMGYGTAAAAPYEWPGSKPEAKRKRGVVTPPPMPAWMRPVLIGQKPVKKPGPVVTPKTPEAPPSPGIAESEPATVVAPAPAQKDDQKPAEGNQ